AHPRHVLALEPRRRLRLAEEALGHLLRGAGEEELDGDLGAQVDVRGRDDHPHPAPAEDALDAVLAREDFAFLDRRILVVAHIVSYGTGRASLRTAPLGVSDLPSFTQ